MRARELLAESESTVESDLTDLLVAAKATDLDELSTQDIADQLTAMGHSVSPDTLVDMLSDKDNKFVKTVTLDKILLKHHTGGEGGSPDEEGDQWDETPEETTQRLAKKAAMKRVADRAKASRKAAKDQL
jgi:hypothetical protein